MLLVKKVLRRTFTGVQYASVGLAPAYRLTSRVRSAHRIPVLVYHKISATDAAASKLTCTVPQARFEAQMSWLCRARFEPIGIEQYVECLTAGRPFPDRSVLITFDDGYESVFSRAYPVLRRYSYPAVVFVVTGSLGAKFFPRDEQFAGLPEELERELTPMTWEQLRETSDLIAAEAHTVTHPRLGRISPENVDWEVRECGRQIGERLGRRVVAFAYPDGIRHHGDYNDATREALVRAGYRVAFNSEVGRNRIDDDPYSQRRIEPKWTDSRALFEAKLVGAYDWVGFCQSAFHRVFAPDPGH